MKIMKTALMVSLLVMLSACASKPIHTNVNTYEEVAKRLVENNKNGTRAKELKADAVKLIELAKPILSAYSKKNPACKELLDHIVAKSEHMQNITLSEIEDKYHDGNGLPQAEETCYEPKELIVHPSTVVILSKAKLNKESREQINDEIEEVLAHLDIFKEEI
jgi:hypothetical protein